ncbi:MAG: STAS domain-containing protein [Phycisphaerales bacterium]
MFSIKATPEPSIDGVIVKMSGAATGTAGAEMQMKLTFVVAGHPRGVVIDVSELEMISSLNIGELVAFRKAIMAGPPDHHGAAYGKVVIAGATPMFEKALTFTRLDAIFPLYPNVASAVEALKVG